MWRPLLAIAAALVLVAQSPSTTPVRAAPAYFLPAPAGTTLLVTQGNNSAFDHVAANGSQYAWDFTEGTAEFPVVASRGGTVIGFRSDSTNTTCRDISCWKDANYVLIDHGDGTSALYLHLATGSVTVTQGQTVAQGAPLGRADSTGFSYGTHLHFMVETTPTARTAAGWWWTQSVQITFVDAGSAVEGMTYVSANQLAAIATATPVPTARPTPKPTPTPTPRPTVTLQPPPAPTGVAVDDFIVQDGPLSWHHEWKITWSEPKGITTGFRLYDFVYPMTANVPVGYCYPPMRSGERMVLVATAGGSARSVTIPTQNTLEQGKTTVWSCGTVIVAVNGAGQSPPSVVYRVFNGTT